jgi:hypothetical protein
MAAFCLSRPDYLDRAMRSLQHAYAEEGLVYAAVTRTTGATGNIAEEAVMVGETMAMWLREVEGFKGMLMLTDEASGTVQVIALWETRQVAERHREARARLRDRVSATVGVQVEETVGFDVPFAFLPG